MEPQRTKFRVNKLPKIKLLSNTPKKLVIFAVIFVVGVVIAGGLYLYQNRSTGAGAYSFKYSQLNSYTVAGDKKGSGITVQKPTEIGESGSTALKVNQTSFTHTLTKNGKELTIAQLSMASVYAGSDLQSSYLANIDNILGDVKNAAHSSVQQPVKTFVTQRIDPSYTATFTEPKAFKNNSIKEHGWSLKFTATSSDKSSNPDISGEVVIAPGKDTYYYLMISSLSINWEKNQKVWDQVTSSIKIDQ